MDISSLDWSFLVPDLSQREICNSLVSMSRRMSEGEIMKSHVKLQWIVIQKKAFKERKDILTKAQT